MEKICCFGTSVTEQKNGYAKFLSKFLNYEITIFGYGSHCLQNAGVIYIDKVINSKPKPNYCILDFFVTGSKDYINDIDCINTIVYKLSQINCKCIFTFFLSRNYNNSGELYYNKIKEYLKEINIYYIDFNNYLNFSEELIKDDVHTTELGAEKYAEIISTMLLKDKENINVPNISLKNNRYFNIQKYELINEIELNENENINIPFNFNCQNIYLVMFIGPYSGIIKINDNKYNTWDVYCFFERTVTREYKINNIKHLKIEQLDKVFNTSNCRRDFDFLNIKKKLIIKEIYYS